MKKILFPTAYTRHSKVAFRYAQKLARYFKAGITLVHIYKNPFPIGKEGDELLEIDKTTIKTNKEDFRKSEMAKLEAFSDEMYAKQYAEIPLDHMVADGNVAEELFKIQQNNGFDIVIMGMRRHNMAEKLFGTTAYTLLNDLDCNILLIPPDSNFMGMDTIVYGTAFEIGELKSIEYLLDWCLAFSTSLHILHVHSPELKKDASENMLALQNHFKEAVKHKVVDFKLMEGRTTEMLEDYIKTTGADLLVLHRRKKGFWQRLLEGSMTRALADKIVIPLLILN